MVWTVPGGRGDRWYWRQSPRIYINSAKRSHRLGCGGDWDRADSVRRDLGAPADPGLSPHAPGQP